MKIPLLNWRFACAFAAVVALVLLAWLSETVLCLASVRRSVPAVEPPLLRGTMIFLHPFFSMLLKPHFVLDGIHSQYRYIIHFLVLYIGHFLIVFTEATLLYICVIKPVSWWRARARQHSKIIGDEQQSGDTTSDPGA